MAVPQIETNSRPDPDAVNGYELVELRTQVIKSRQLSIDFEGDIYSSSLEDFSAKHQAPLRIASEPGLPGLRFVKPQVKCAEWILSHSDDVMCEAPTGSGKTAVGSLVVGTKLKIDAAVLIIAPTKILCDQWYERINQFLDLSECGGPESVILLSGDHHRLSAKKRLLAYANPNAKVLITTPEALEKDFEKINLSRVKLAIIDEGDEARHQDAVNLVNGKLKTCDIRQVLFSAAFEDKSRDVVEMSRRLGARYYPIAVEPQLFEKDEGWISLQSFQEEWRMAEIRVPATILERALEDDVDAVRRCLTSYDENLLPILDKAVLDKEGKLKWPSPHAWEGVIGGINRVASEIREQTGDLPSDLVFGIHAAYRLQHIPHLHEALTVSGCSTFMRLVSENILATRFGITYWSGHKEGNPKAGYRRNLYDPKYMGDSPVLKAFHYVASGQHGYDSYGTVSESPIPTLYLPWATAKSIPEVINQIIPENERGRYLDLLKDEKSIGPMTEELLVMARNDLASRGINWSNHPKEEDLIADLYKYFSIRGDRGRALVYTYYADHAFFLEKAISQTLGPLGVQVNAITGSSYQDSPERGERLWNFRNSDNQVLIFTDVAKKGLDTPAEHLYVYNMPWLGRDLVQLIGRIRNHERFVPWHTDPSTGKATPKSAVKLFVASDTLEVAKHRSASSGLKAIKRRQDSVA